MRVEVICTGDEVLTGKVVNTNFSHISRKLEDCGLSAVWETTVGDDRDSLLLAFRLAGERADAVIVNGGLGPTVDDLSQEVAARAAGVELVLNEAWLERMEAFFRSRSRVMPPNNRKQALLPAGAEVLDNPAGTACGFALNIGRARFYFTPGVPRELQRMLDEQVIPRLLAASGAQTTVRLKRFHTYGIGESHADALLDGIEMLAPGVKLGFRAHYPQLETKLTARGAGARELQARMAPVEAEVRRRFGNFILGEDEDTLEGVVLAALAARGATLCVVETFTGGAVSARLAQLPAAAAIVRRGVYAPDTAGACAALGMDDGHDPGTTPQGALAVAQAALRASGASVALAVLVAADAGPDRHAYSGSVSLAIAGETQSAVRRSRIIGGRDWVHLGAVELALDCLRRWLQGLPVDERIDFEKTGN